MVNALTRSLVFVLHAPVFSVKRTNKNTEHNGPPVTICLLLQPILNKYIGPRKILWSIQTVLNGYDKFIILKINMPPTLIKVMAAIIATIYLCAVVAEDANNDIGRWRRIGCHCSEVTGY